MGDGGEQQVGTAHQKWLRLVSPLAKFNENWDFKNTLGLTLAQQLAQLEDPTPIDVDPEDGFLMAAHDGEDGEAPEETSDTEEKAHYLTVDRSNLRNLHESLNEARYSGRKITRELGDMHLSDSADDSQHSEGGSSSEHTENDTESDKTSSDEEMQALPEVKDTEELNTVLQRARDSDHSKGKAVSKQMAIWDSILDARIRLQKASALCNMLPLEPTLGRLSRQEDGQRPVVAFLREALLLSEDLFELNEALLSASAGSNKDTVANPRKRKRAEISSDNVEVLAAQVKLASQELARVQQEFHPQLLATLQKWSAKIQAVTPASLLPSARGAFRTNRNAHIKSVTEIIQESLSDHPRAVARTRIRRGGLRIDASDSAENGLDVDGKPLEEAEVFDDADFYQQLLRDVIDGQVSNVYGEDDLNIRPKKIKRKVDTRASKGRKLRYDVHEKIQNFMVPIPTIVDGWHEEKIDELFSSLLGNSPAEIEKRVVHPTAVIQDGFRIFG